MGKLVRKVTSCRVFLGAPGYWGVEYDFTGLEYTNGRANVHANRTRGFRLRLPNPLARQVRRA